MIEIKDLVKTYSTGDINFTALRKVSLNIQKGEYTSIMGPSGSGKSTFMNILGCLDKMNEGKYYLNQKDISEMQDDEVSYFRPLIYCLE